MEALEYLLPSPLIPKRPELDVFVEGLELAPGPARRCPRPPDGRRRGPDEKAVTRTKTDVAELVSGSAVGSARTTPRSSSGPAEGWACRALRERVRQPPRRDRHSRLVPGLGGRIGRLGSNATSTHSEFVGNEHIATAVGCDYHDVPPNRGLWKGRADETISVSVKVEPVDRVPLVERLGHPELLLHLRPVSIAIREASGRVFLKGLRHWPPIRTSQAPVPAS